MSETRVWVSDALRETTNVLPYQVFGLGDETSAFQDAALRNQLNGAPLPADRIPDRFKFKYPKSAYDDVPGEGIFNLDGWLAMTQACAEVLGSHDIGQNSLHPVTLFDSDETTQVPTPLFLVNFGEARDALVPEQSKNISYSKITSLWKLSLDLTDNEAAVSQSAINGADLWVDPKLWRMFFVSDRLRNALVEAELSEPFLLHECKLLP